MMDNSKPAEFVFVLGMVLQSELSFKQAGGIFIFWSDKGSNLDSNAHMDSCFGWTGGHKAVLIDCEAASSVLLLFLEMTNKLTTDIKSTGMCKWFVKQISK